MEPETEKNQGIENIKKMFQIDEFGSISAELNSVYQAGLFGALVGCIYGGIIHSRESYISFMEKNQATAFKSHLDAKKQLQNNFTVNFAKGGLKWGTRLGLFTTSFVGLTTISSVYREKTSITDYVLGGAITGGLWKFSLGLRGIAAGTLIGCVMGAVAGTASVGLLKITGRDMNEIRYWQYKWKEEREAMIRSGMSKQMDPEDKLPPSHKDSQKLSLDEIKI